MSFFITNSVDLTRAIAKGGEAMSENHFLIIRPSRWEVDLAKKASSALFWDFRLEAKTTTQQLMGRGYILFQEGYREGLEKLSEKLEQCGYRSWIVPADLPRIRVQQSTSVRITERFIRFQCGKAHIDITRGSAVLAILADASGSRMDFADLSAAEKYNAIMAGSPVLDLYILSDDGKAEAAVRIFAGRFDPPGPGESTRKRGVKTLQRIITRAHRYAGAFYLSMDFSLAKLPGCGYKQGDEAETIQSNLKGVLRYGVFLTAMRARSELAEENITGVSDFDFEAAESISKTSEAGEPAPETLPPPPWPPRENEKEVTLKTFLLALLSLPVIGLVLILILRIGSDWMVSIGDPSVFIHGFLLWAGAAALFIFGLYNLRLGRIVKRTPTSNAGLAASGIVELKGRAVRKYDLASPMTEVPCVYYNICKYKWRTGQRSGWHKYKQISSGPVPFYIEDDTGKVLVEPDGARIERVRKQEFKDSVMLMTQGVRIPMPAKEKWVEELIHDGSPLYVLGEAVPDRHRRDSIKTRLADRLRQLKKDRDELMKYDKDADGVIDETEWETARADMERRVVEESSATKTRAKEKRHRLVVRKSKTGGAPFIIAPSREEGRLIRRYGVIGALSLVSSVILAVCAIV